MNRRVILKSDRLLPRDDRKPFDRGGDLGDDFLCSRCRHLREFGQMDHRHQFADGGQRPHQVVKGPLAQPLQAMQIAAPGLLALLQTLIAGFVRGSGGRFLQR